MCRGAIKDGMKGTSQIAYWFSLQSRTGCDPAKQPVIQSYSRTEITCLFRAYTTSMAVTVFLLACSV